MKTATVALLSILFLISFNSCRQCTTCVKYPAPDKEICKKDYASTESYNEAYRQIVAEGYDCD